MSYAPTVAEARNTGSSHDSSQLLHVHWQCHPLRRLSDRPTGLLELATKSNHHGRSPPSTFPCAQTISKNIEAAPTSANGSHTESCLSGIVRRKKSVFHKLRVAFGHRSMSLSSLDDNNNSFPSGCPP